MSSFAERLQVLKAFQGNAALRIFTLGQFTLHRAGKVVSSKEWGRDKTIQLFQYLISSYNKRAQHKEQIIDRLWDEDSDRDFKVAIHGVNKVLEPDRAARVDPKYLLRQGLTYRLDTEQIWVDIQALEQYVELANEALALEPDISIQAFQEAIHLYQGVFLPNRIYEDWSAVERERVQIIVLGAYFNLAELLLDKNPMESIRLSQNALKIDPSWEDIYRIQMKAYIKNGNRPQAIKTYKKCEQILTEEYGIVPLPETKALLATIQSI